ncbi:MAG TPA: hypothetical protein VI749_08100 [Candidatus Omnitrophota bacterium]|nr:hypothetical protein [Candidatus Omnitrophota bacterium]
MPHQIDQSGKIEATSKNTILCLSNDEWIAVKIEAKAKRQLQEIFRRNGQPRNFVLFTFSAGLAILLDRTKHISRIMVDQEYYGKEAVIKNIVLKMLKHREGPLEINFGNIGKKALAHHRAYAVATGRLKASYTVGLKELYYKIKMTEVGKRLKNA